MTRGVVLVSHVAQIPEGLKRLVAEVAKDVPVTTAGGLENNGVGTSMERILTAINDNAADEIYAFYDLGSAKMNLELAIEMTEKKVQFFDVAFIEGAYTACALLQAGVEEQMILDELAPLEIK